MSVTVACASLVLLCIVTGIKSDHRTQYNDAPCERLQLTAPGKLDFISGIYQLKHDVHFVVYTHECRSLYLHRIPRGGARPVWVIGPDIGSKRGYVMTENLNRADWKRWNEHLSTWLIDSAISSTCDDTCQMFTLGGNVPIDLRGPYLREPKTHSGLPVYKHREMDMFVYHNMSPCRHWAIGSSVGNTKSFFFSMSVQSNVLNAEKWLANHISGKPVEITPLFQCHEKLPRIEDNCGERQSNIEAQGLIVNGADATKGDWPFMVSYKRPGGQHKCGAVVINRRWVLTAGHCVPKNDESELTMIEVGVHDLQNANTETMTYAVRRTLHHPDFMWSTKDFKLLNDIGLIELHSDLMYDAFVQPVCLPSFAQDTFSFSSAQFSYNFSSCFLIGWGEQWYQGPPGVLQRARVASAASVDVCATHRMFHSHLSWMREAHSLCVQAERGGRICKGDSGSPLLCEREGRWFVMGVASWSLTQCFTYVSGIPSIYEQVAPWLPWIRRYI